MHKIMPNNPLIHQDKAIAFDAEGSLKERFLKTTLDSDEATLITNELGTIFRQRANTGNILDALRGIFSFYSEAKETGRKEISGVCASWFEEITNIGIERISVSRFCKDAIPRILMISAEKLFAEKSKDRNVVVGALGNYMRIWEPLDPVGAAEFVDYKNALRSSPEDILSAINIAPKWRGNNRGAVLLHLFQGS